TVLVFWYAGLRLPPGSALFPYTTLFRSGYLLLMVGIALLIAQALPAWAAFGIVAIANLIGGGAVSAAFAAKARQEKVALPRTGEELRRDREWISAMGNGHAVPSAPAGEPMTVKRDALHP